MWLNNVNIIRSEGLQNIQIADGKIKHITTEKNFAANHEEITIVVNHGEKLPVPNPFITVLQDNHSLHSVQFEKFWRFKLNNPFAKKQPYVIHAGEGTDEAAHNEINQLIKMNFFNKSLFTVH